LSSKKLPEIYFIAEGYCLVLNEKESVGHVFSKEPEYFEWISACRCNKCGQIIIIFGDAQFDHAKEREMGPEYWYFDTQYYNCPNCGQSIIADLILTQYAYIWDCELDLSGAEKIHLEGLRELAEIKAHYESILSEKRTLEQRILILQNRIQQIKDRAESIKIYVLIVEGKDDQVIWEQFLKREGAPMDSIEILTYGKGGIDEAIKAATMFRGRVLRKIPHKLIIDSDNNIKEVESKLKKHGIRRDNFHILKEKEIEAYLLDEEAIARVLSIDITELKEFIKKLKGARGKEKLDAIGNRFIGHPPNSQTKGLIARAIKEVPEEIRSIISEIIKVLSSEIMEEDYENDLF